MKEKKLRRWIEVQNSISSEFPNRGYFDSGFQQSSHTIPSELVLETSSVRGICFGATDRCDMGQYVGMEQGEEGNILILGGNGSGKSTGIAMPTLQTWAGAICVTDIKGELSDFYAKLYAKGLVQRRYLVFDPLDEHSVGYDPFWWLAQDGELNLVGNIWEIVVALIPDVPNDNQPFWIETERSILAAALHYFYGIGTGFIEGIISLLVSPMQELSEKIYAGDNDLAKIYLGDASKMKEETLAGVDRELRNKLLLFATDPYISSAFGCEREEQFTWQDLDKVNIFLRIPPERIEQWSSAINLMYTQLIHFLERRPDKYSSAGKKSIQTLLLLDEFARFGKLAIIPDAMATLRSKNVNICLVLQSMAQLDKIYGEHDRRIIFDNCRYKAILRADDAETQKFLCELIGTCQRKQYSVGENVNEVADVVGYGKQVTEIREWTIFPHELSTLEDVVLLSPYGVCRARKITLASDWPKMEKIFAERQTNQLITVNDEAVWSEEWEDGIEIQPGLKLISVKVYEKPVNGGKN